MANEALSGAGEGAASGAATGMVAGPWGALVGAAVGAIGGFMKGRAEHRQAKQINQMRAKSAARMRTLASPEHLQEVVNHLQPLMRNVVESGLGPQFKAEIDKGLASHGLTGTGAGEAIRSMSQAAPGIFATEQATAQGEKVVGNELNAEASASGLEPVQDNAANPLMEALLGGARGYISGGGTFGRRPQTGANNLTPQPNTDPYAFYNRVEEPLPYDPTANRNR